MEPRGLRQRGAGEAAAMGGNENAAPAAPPETKRPPRGGKRKALAELPTADNASAVPPVRARACKPRTRSAAREEAEAREGRGGAEEAGGMADVARLLGTKAPDDGAAQQAIVPYAADIDQYLRSLEVEPQMQKADYIGEIQEDISINNRGVLVDWMVDVAEEFNLLADTLHLAVSYVDRFLSRSVITRQNLQLLGTAALLVAAKYEETKPPKTKKFSEITDDTYTKLQVVKMEADILKSLNFEMGSPTVITFLRRFITSCRGGNRSGAKKLELVCSYLAELSLLHYYCITFPPSLVAAACLFVARFTISPKTRPWNLKLQNTTGYKVSDLKYCIFAIHDLQSSRKWPDLKAIRDKYKGLKFESVSTIASLEKIPLSFLEDPSK